MLYACATATAVMIGAHAASAKPFPFDPTGRTVTTSTRATLSSRTVMNRRMKKKPAAVNARGFRHAKAVAASPCALSRAERARRIGRSIEDVLDEEAANAELVAEASQKAGVPVHLALGVGYHESRLDTCAVSHTGVRGVMQVTKETARWLKLNRDKNRENILAGVTILKRAVARCGEEDFTCLARRYNASTASEQAKWAAGVELAAIKIETHLEGRPYLTIRKRPEPKVAIVMLATAGELL
jgi:soluble lytic murein transglycosylase-like protein